MVVPGERLYLRLDYDPARFDRGTAEAIAARFVRLLEHAVESPDLPLHRLQLLTAGERQTLLETFNATAHGVPEANLPGLFEAQAVHARRGGARPRGPGAELRRANRACQPAGDHLIGLGVGPEALVGVCLEQLV